MAEPSNRIFTVYGLVASDAPGIIRYVGQTSKPIAYRLCGHRSDAKLGRAAPVNQWVRAVFARGQDIRAVILVEDALPDEDESRLIEQFRQIGHLLNERSGGRRGLNSEATKARMRAAQAVILSDPDERGRRALNIATAMTRPETRAKHRAGVLAAKAKPEVLDKNRGVLNGSARLDEAKVREMRERFATGESTSSLARSFGVSQPSAWHVVHGRSWTHVV